MKQPGWLGSIEGYTTHCYIGIYKTRHCKDQDPYQYNQICPKNPGFPRSNPMTWGWDVSTINPTRNRSYQLELSTNYRIPREDWGTLGNH